MNGPGRPRQEPEKDSAGPDLELADAAAIAESSPLAATHPSGSPFDTLSVSVEGYYPDGDRHPSQIGKRARASVLPDRSASSLHLKFVDVRYKVVMKTRGKGNSGVEKGEGKGKEILHGVSGMASPGQILAVMGPSGSGKTTLLNVIGGRTPCSSQIFSGTITYNGMPFDKKLKSRIGFVTQDDVLFPHLTVRETLMYAALLRLPKIYSKKEKIERADVVISQLGLDRCRDTVIGGAFLRGVSGGERKRVCIGHEILVDPSLLFLDEPTSGLDSTTALQLIQLLRSIAHGGRTVVTTIHQPSSRLMNMFEKLILLSDGNSFYYGNASDAADYFESLGFKPLITMNPAEYFIDLCSGNTSDMLLPPSLQQQCHVFLEDTGNVKEDDHTKTEISSTAQLRPAPKDVKQYLADAYREQMGSKELAKFVESMPVFTHEDMNGGEEVEKKSFSDNYMEHQWNTTWWQQFTILLIRGFKERRHEYLGWLRIVQVFASAIVAGCLWWQSKIKSIHQLEDQVGLLFFLAYYWGYLPLVTAIFTFPSERAVFTKERGSKMYRTSAYFLARTSGDLPLDMILPVVFILIVYFMAHLHYSVAAFFLTLLAIFLIVITAQSVGLLIGAAVMDVKKATTLASVLFVTFALTGGFILQNIPPFISWLKYLSFQYYGFRLLVKIQYTVRDLAVAACPRGKSTCNPQLASLGALHGVTLGGGGEEVLALVVMTVIFQIGSYMALRRVK